MSATDTLDATVESLCGDLSHIRAPRGSQLNARSWSTEAPLRMLLNNLDPEVAERPEDLVVYGGSGKAARNHDALRAIVRTLLQLGDDETLLGVPFYLMEVCVLSSVEDGCSMSAILFFISLLTGCSERHTNISGCTPYSNNSFTECCVGFVFNSPVVDKYGIKVRCITIASEPSSHFN